MAIKSPEDADPDIFAKIRMRQRILILLICQLVSLLASSHEIYMALQQDDLRIITTKTAGGTIIQLPRIGKNLTTSTTKSNLDIVSTTNLGSDLKTQDSDKILNKIFGCSVLGVEGMLENPKNISLSEKVNLSYSACCNKNIRNKLTPKLEQAMTIGNRRSKGQNHRKQEYDRDRGQGQGQVKTQRQTKSVGKEKSLPPSITVFALSATAIVITLTNYFAFINYRNPYLRKVMLNLICFLGFIIQVINCTTFYSGIQIQVENSPHLDYCDQNNLNQNIRIVPNTVTVADIGDIKGTSSSDALNGNGDNFDIKIDGKVSQKLVTLCLLHLQEQIQLKRSDDLDQEEGGNIIKVKVSRDFDSDTDNGPNASSSCPSFVLLYILWSLMILTTVLIPLTIIYSCKWRDRTFFRLIDDISFGRKGTLFSRQRSMIQQVKFDLETELDFDKRTLDQLQECLLEEYEMLKVLENNLKYKYMLMNNNNNNDDSQHNQKEQEQKLLPTKSKSIVANQQNLETDADAHNDTDSSNAGQPAQAAGVENTTRNINANNRTHADNNTDSEAKLSGQSQSSLSTNSTTLATEYDAYVAKLRDYNLQLSAFMNKAEAFQEIRKLDLQILEEYAHYVNFTKFERLQPSQALPE